MTQSDKKSTYLGYAPTHINKEDIFSYFVYVFEMTWMVDLFESRRNSIMTFLDDAATKEHPNYKDFPADRQWWLLALVVMKEIAEKYNGGYAKETVIHLIRRLPDIDSEKLRIYVNVLSVVIANEFPANLIVRPLEQARLGVGSADDEMIKSMIDNHEAVVKIMKKHMTQKDLNRNYLDMVLMKDWKLVRKYSNIWNSLFELLIYMFNSIYISKISYDNMTSEEVDGVIKETILFYLIAAVTKKELIETIQLELFESLRGVNKKSRVEKIEESKDSEGAIEAQLSE
jgi:hypothetical protein